MIFKILQILTGLMIPIALYLEYQMKQKGESKPKQNSMKMILLIFTAIILIVALNYFLNEKMEYLLNIMSVLLFLIAYWYLKSVLDKRKSQKS